jgi:hypothetical protein
MTDEERIGKLLEGNDHGLIVLSGNLLEGTGEKHDRSQENKRPE